MMLKVLHLTTVHNPYDTRIYLKMCKSLSKDGFETSLICPESKSYTDEYGVNIIGIGSFEGKWSRIIFSPIKAFINVLRLKKPDLVHFHDPELIPVCLILKILGYKIIYDVHENVPEQIKYKFYLNNKIRSMVSGFVKFLEKISYSFFDGIITVNEQLANRFEIGNTQIIENFPIQKELVVSNPTPFTNRPARIVYIGNIVKERGIEEVIQSFELLPENYDLEFVIAGKFGDSNLEKKLKSLPGWKRVKFIGWVNREEASELLNSSRVGLIVSHPTTEYIGSLPNKLLEYMSVGLPVVASDYEQMKSIVSKANCGLLFKPFDLNDLITKIRQILDNPQLASEMGRNGRAEIELHYSWSSEFEKLKKFYLSICN